MLNLGIISYDHPHAHRVHKWGLQLVTDRVQVVAIADPDFTAVESDVQAYDARYFADYQELLAWERVDAVLITSVNARHARMTLEAAEAGKHVLCEKPVCIDLEAGEAAVDACRRAGVAFATAFPVRHAPETQRLLQCIEAGDVGAIRTINATNHGNAYAAAGTPAWVFDATQSGGGSVMDHTVHCADLIRWFTGAEAVEVYAETATLFRDEIDVEDAGLVHLRLSDDTIATIDASWSRLPSFPGWGDLTLHITGDTGRLFLDFGGDVLRVYGDDPMQRTRSYDETNAYGAMFADFAAAAAQGRPPLATGYDGLKASEIALAAYESVRRTEPVSLPMS